MKKRILVVDDNERLAAVNERMIRRNLPSPIDITLAYDGQEALRLVQQDPDAHWFVRTDWEMPKLDGLQLAYALRHLDPPVRAYVLLTSGRGVSQSVAEECGIDDVIDKGDPDFQFRFINHIKDFLCEP
jgi:CheY-like chemotaxis protein